MAVSAQDALADFLAHCDPATPAAPEAYVPRPQPFAPWMSKTLSRVDRAKVLLMGQSGVGKSTELARLRDGLGEQFTLIQPPIDEILDLTIAGWHDILVLTALWYAQDQGWLREHDFSHGGLRAKPLEQQLVKGLATPNVPGPTGLQAFRNEPKSIHSRVASGPAQFWDLALDVLNSASGQVVLVFDGLEKLPRIAADRLFQNERRYLVELPLRTVVTAPVAMSFEPYFGEVEGDFLAVTRLRALSHRPGEPGFQFLRELAVKRGAYEVMRSNLLDEMISWSGGLPRQMLQLLAAAATQALTDGLYQIESESFSRARRKVTERWQYQLEPTDYESLAKQDQDRTASERSRLLLLGALLEYDQPDGGLGLGVNPLVGALVKQRQTASA